ncbi:SufE family protein [Oricola cellulosilytica]|uniref:SufE family protein n=1 Tax=Oricola cellulosilytica TaxID=1429082 RepID=A0A4R0PCS0_9HYPH|nr:SufE family protein [Oricola cellulosilytica]TCD14099.1 SufE family protein [Oricola cellulosilytica]
MLPNIATIIDDFEFLDEWEDKYRYVIELGRQLPEMPESEKTPANKVNGCVSQVWLVPEITGAEDPVVYFRGDSDAHIVRGLVAIMIAAMSGKQASEIETFDAQSLMHTLGLEENLTPQRSNGLRSMIARMKDEARSAAQAA